jgi:signal transduction histidine kinase
MVRLISLVAHELRTPLSVASGYLKMLDSGRLGSINEPQRKAIVASQRACDQLLTLASDLSFLASLERGDAVLQRTAVLASTLVADALAACAKHEPPVRFESVGEDDVTVVVDPIRMRHAIESLVRCVARTLPDGSTVRVSRVLHEDAGRTSLAVIIAQDGDVDPLAAIDHSHLEPIDEWQGGLGVGLPLARRFIAVEGGDVRALETKQPSLVILLPVATDQVRFPAGAVVRA